MPKRPISAGRCSLSQSVSIYTYHWEFIWHPEKLSTALFVWSKYSKTLGVPQNQETTAITQKKLISKWAPWPVCETCLHKQHIHRISSIHAMVHEKWIFLINIWKISKTQQVQSQQMTDACHNQWIHVPLRVIMKSRETLSALVSMLEVFEGTCNTIIIRKQL